MKVTTIIVALVAAIAAPNAGAASAPKFVQGVLVHRALGHAERIYASLHPAQKPYVTLSMFVECEREAFKGYKVRLTSFRVSRVYRERVAVPGTPVIGSSTAVKMSYKVSINGGTPQPDSGTSHAFSIKGRWHWALGVAVMRAYKAGVCP